MDAISIKKSAAKHAAELQAYYGEPVSRLTVEQVAVYMGLIGDESLGDALVTDLAAEKQARVVAGDAIKTAICAKAAHEVNRVWCEAHGDYSVRPWENADQWQRESAIKGVAGVLSGNSPEQQHEAWCADKAATGWRYGTVKDPDAKTHPCMVPYSALPEVQRAKDALFVSTVKAMSAAMAFSVPEAS